MHSFEIISHDKLTKVQQIVQVIRREIEKGKLKKDSKLPSINYFSREYNVARDTIEKAYRELKKEEYIVAVPGNGYFVAGKKETRLKILLIFNKLSSYKKLVYDSFLETLGSKAKVDLQIHHYDPHLLKEILENNLGKYHYYVVMPHFFLNANEKECRKIFGMIPENELVILDKIIPGLEGNYTAVYQDFQQDIYNVLLSAKDLLSKYDKMSLLLDVGDNHPQEIIIGATQFCMEHRTTLTIAARADQVKIQKKTVYIVTTEDDLAVLVKELRASGLQPGKDVGIISFNETVLKELLDITVITTDFAAMGKTAATCILEKKLEKISNPFFMIRRGSL